MQIQKIEKVLPWYLGSCVVPYLPYVLSSIFTDRSADSLWIWLSLLLLAGLAVFFNVIAGPVLIWHVRGAKRVFVLLAFAMGALFPAAVMISSYFHSPMPPAAV
jgi:hypothetical protein